METKAEGDEESGSWKLRGAVLLWAGLQLQSRRHARRLLNSAKTWLFCFELVPTSAPSTFLRRFPPSGVVVLLHSLYGNCTAVGLWRLAMSARYPD